MAEALYSSGKHGLATEPGSLAGAVLRRLLLSESDLPEGIQFLPALFRLMAFLLFLPVAMLTLVDLIGWCIFKAILRPLGYTSTIRFKDPEPPSLSLAPATDLGRSASPASSSGILPSEDSSSSGASDTYPSPTSSDNLSLPDVDSDRNSLSGVRSSTKSGRRKKHSRGADTNSSFNISRDRAPSVGLDGPLFGDETDGLTTPGTESDASDYMSPRPAAGSDDATARRLRGEGVPRGGFKLGLTEVHSRPSASSATQTDA